MSLNTFIVLFYLIMVAGSIFYIWLCNHREQQQYQEFLKQRKIAVLEDTIERWKKYVPLKERL